MLKNFFKVFFKILNIFFIILSFVLVFIAIFKKEWFELFIEFMRWIINSLGYYNYLIIFFSWFIEAFPVLGVLMPSQNILLIVSWFFIIWTTAEVATNTPLSEIKFLIFFLVVFVSWFWSVCWNYIWYILWKIYWDLFFEKYWIWFGIWKTEVSYLEKWIEKWWALWITFWKFHPLTRSFLPFIAGQAKMKSKKFMLYNTIWSFLWAFVMVIFWVIFINYYKIFLDNAWTISFVVIFSIWIYIYFFKKNQFLKYLDEKNKEIEGIASKK